MSSVTLHRILYRSDAELGRSGEETEALVEAIVSAADRWNRRDGISGALTLHAGTFIQALEGPMGAVEATFERVCRDLRHRRLGLLEMSVASERLFGEWGMAWARPPLGIGALGAGTGAPVELAVPAKSASEIMRLMRVSLRRT